MHPEQLFELFYQDVTPEMNPPEMPKYKSQVDWYWWRERFMNAFYGIKEQQGLRSWGEAPQMWLKGYDKNSQKIDPNPSLN